MKLIGDLSNSITKKIQCIKISLLIKSRSQKSDKDDSRFLRVFVFLGALLKIDEVKECSILFRIYLAGSESFKPVVVF